MKIAVVGVGAMGAIYAGFFADAGHEVWAIDIWKEHIDAIKNRGLRVSGASGDRIVTSINASDQLVDAGVCDLYIIATKASGVGEAASAISSLVGSNSLVLTIQNGLGAIERIAEYMDISNVLLGVADGFGASIKSPGHAHHNGMNLIRLGETSGGVSERLDLVTRIWQQAGFKAKAFDDINQLIWEKYICNCTYSAPCTVFSCTLGELMENSANFKIALGCTKEVFELGEAKGIVFSFDDPVNYVINFGKKMPNAKPSMLLDHEVGRLSEIDAINGKAVELGQELGISTPYNETVSAIVRTLEKRFIER
ncbi:MAG: 2-dehydropantoate 2-reductase [Magnetovibrio sp.]|nr:2-dehydropantoate 2-reductase [Magnetovibrio sp.]